MGLKITGELRRRAMAAGVPRRHPRPGQVTGFIPGEPPTVTHHDKVLAPRGNRLRPVDSAALRAARTEYLSKIPPCPHAPVAGPVYAYVEFRWTDARAAEHAWRQLKPDADNAGKVVIDLLAHQGYLDNDAKVARLEVVKLNLPTWSAAAAGVYVELATIAGPPPEPMRLDPGFTYIDTSPAKEDPAHV